MPILALWGDSNTYSIASRLAATNALPAGWAVDNRGLGGEPSDLGLVRLQNWLATNPVLPDVALLCWAGADVLNGMGILAIPDAVERDAEWAAHNTQLAIDLLKERGVKAFGAEGVGCRVRPHPDWTLPADWKLTTERALELARGYNVAGERLRAKGPVCTYALCQRKDLWLVDQIHASLVAQDMVLVPRVTAFLRAQGVLPA